MIKAVSRTQIAIVMVLSMIVTAIVAVPARDAGAATSLPVWDTAWSATAWATPAEIDVYFDHLSSTGYTGVLINVFPTLGGLGRSASATGQPSGTITNGELRLTPAHATWIGTILDKAQARGLKVGLMAAWASAYVSSFVNGQCTPGAGPVDASNSFALGVHLGNEFGGHPALGIWGMGGDNYCDPDPDAAVWANMAAGLRSTGANEMIGYHTPGGRPGVFVDQPWNEVHLAQTGHCWTTAQHVADLSAVVNSTNKPVYAAELSYEAITPSWNGCGTVTPEKVIADGSAVASQTGVAAMLYGHNERWQWGFGLHGSGGEGWTSVQQSLGAPGETGLFDVLNGNAPPPTLPPTTVPASDSCSVNESGSAATVTWAIGSPGTPVLRKNGSYQATVDATGSWSDSNGAGADWTIRLWTSDFVDITCTTGGTPPTTAPSTTAPSTTAPSTTLPTTTTSTSTSTTTTVPAGPDTVDPVISVSSPADGSTIGLGTHTVAGTASDPGSGVSRVRLTVQRRSDRAFWNGTSWQSSFVSMVPTGGTSWSLAGVSFDQTGEYWIRPWAKDNAGNVAKYSENAITKITVSAAGPPPTTTPSTTSTTSTTTSTTTTTTSTTTTAAPGPDVIPPTVVATSPADGAAISTGVRSVSGTVTDAGSGPRLVRIAIIRRGSPAAYWNGSTWTSSFTSVSAVRSGNTWSVSGVDFDQAGEYWIRVWAKDNAGNVSRYLDNPIVKITAS